LQADAEQIGFMRRAIEIACENVKNNGGPFGALVVKDGQIIAESGNSVVEDADPTAHAEVNAIRKACKALGTHQLDGCEIYSSCEPCPMCLSAIYWARIDRLYFSASKLDAEDAGFLDRFIYDEIALPITERGLKSEQIELENSCNPFKEWGADDTKQEY